MQQAEAGTLPFGEDTEAAADLRFAAARTIEHAEALCKHRDAILGAVRELGDRCWPFTKRLVQLQQPTANVVAGKVHIGFVALLTVILEWADWRLPARFVTGFQTTGILEHSNIYDRADIHPPKSVAEILAEAPAVLKGMERWPMDEEADSIWESCLKQH